MLVTLGAFKENITMRHIILDTEEFELLPLSDFTLICKLRYFSSDYTNIYKCYEKPSISKIAIWNKWITFAKDNNCKNVKIMSYNCHFFTIGMSVKIDGAVYLLVITPRHKYIIKV